MSAQRRPVAWAALLACGFLGVGLGAASRLVGRAHTADARVASASSRAATRAESSAPADRTPPSPELGGPYPAGSVRNDGARGPLGTPQPLAADGASPTHANEPGPAATSAGDIAAPSNTGEREFCVVRPAGVGHAEFVRAVEAGSASRWVASALEPTSAILRRRTELNRTARSVLAQGDFQFVSIRYNSEVDTLVGDARGGLNMPSEAYLAMAAGMAGVDARGVDAEVKRRFEDRLIQYERDRRSLVHAAWGALERATQNGGAAALPEYSWVACFSRGDALSVIPPGADPELDGWIQEVARLAAAMRADLPGILTR